MFGHAHRVQHALEETVVLQLGVVCDPDAASAFALPPLRWIRLIQVAEGILLLCISWPLHVQLLLTVLLCLLFGDRVELLLHELHDLHSLAVSCIVLRVEHLNDLRSTMFRVLQDDLHHAF